MINKLKIYKIFCICISLLLTNLEMYCAARMESESASELGSQLITAVNSGNKETVKRLLESKANVEFSVPDTPLRTAIKLGNKDIFKLLIGAKANVNAVGSSWDTILMIAARHGDHEIVDLLIKSGADINGKNSDSENALIIAFNAGNNEAAKLLLDNGIDFNTEDRNKKNPMLIAIIKSDINLVKLLINAKIDINAQTRFDDKHVFIRKNKWENENSGPRDESYYCRPQVMRRNMENEKRELFNLWNQTTYLIVAVRNRLVNIVQLMLKAGANLDIKDNYKKKQ